MLEYDSYYVFNIGDKYFLFDIFNMECVYINKSTYEALKKKDEGLLDRQTDSVLKGMLEKQLFFYDTQLLRFNKDASTDVLFSLAPVTECNLRCKYCFADAGKKYCGDTREFTVQTICDIAKYIDNRFPNAKKIRLDFVSGGEPLLNFELTKKVIETIKKYFEDKNKKIDIWLCTNGTLITSDILHWLDNIGVNIGICLDGDQTINDENRIYPNNQGTYFDVKKSISLIKNDITLTNQFKYLWGLCVVTPNTRSLVDVLRHHKNLGFNNIQMKFVRLSKNHPLSFGYNNISLAYKLIDELLDYVQSSLLENELENVIFFANNNDHIGKILIRLILKKPFIYRCQAGRNKLSFSPNGDIYPCDSFIGNPNYVLGNIYDNVMNYKLINDFEFLSVINRKKCKSCWARFVCGGDCFHNSFCANDTMDTPDDIFCKITKHTIVKSLSVLNNVSLCNKKIISELRNFLIARERVR